MKIDGINHIALNVRKLSRAELFYTKVLGFEVVSRVTDGTPHIMVNTGNSAVALFEAPDLEMDQHITQLSEEGYMHFAFGASKDQMDITLVDLKKENIEIEGPVSRGNGTSIYFNDPDGNHLEIHFE